MRTLALSLAALAFAACKPLGPDPVVEDGIDVGPIQSFEAERAPGGVGMGSIVDNSASDTHALEFYSGTSTIVPCELLTEVSGFVVRARGEACHGWPELEMKVDGVVRLKTEVRHTRWTDYSVIVALHPGMHTFEMGFTNDYWDGKTCDRNLILDKVTFVNAASLNRGPLRGAAMLLPSGVQIVPDGNADGGKAAAFMSSAVATGETQLDAPAKGLVVRARGDQCDGPPEMQLTVDGIDRGFFQVSSKTWADYRAPVDLQPGVHALTVAFLNDKYYPGCDRNLYVDVVAPIAEAPPAVPVALPGEAE